MPLLDPPGSDPAPSPPYAASATLQVSPDCLDVLGSIATSIGWTVDELADAAGRAFAELAAAMPGSALEAALPPARTRCPDLLRAEGVRLRDLGVRLSRTAAAYREQDIDIAGRLQGLAP
jgi:hypothetical protein